MDEAPAFGPWLRQRRRALDLTREALGRRVGCAGATIAKIEAGLRRPSQQVAERLADALAVAPDERAAFVSLARGVTKAPPTLPMAVTPAAALPGLPTPLTPLVGREAELRQVSQQLRRPGLRLLTLIGSPGVGKTRLAVEVARRLAPLFRDGASFVSLAAVSDPERLLDAIASALDVPEQPGTTAFEQLQSLLGAQQRLLVLDNLEQLVPGATPLAQLLGACPGLTLLTTSRERLWLRGEQLVRVTPLATAVPSEQGGLAQIEQAPAVQLFVQVARCADASFALTDANAHDVVALCKRLDGLPLAIELVAAHCDTRSPAALLTRLDQLLLTGEGPRDLPPRQRNLRAALDWSYALLNDAEQRLFRRLGLLLGNWPPEAAAQLVVGRACDADSSELLRALAGKSLVQHSSTGDAEAFTMLATLRAYALERLEASGETADARARHARYYGLLAAQAATQLTGDWQQSWMARLREAYPNLQSAFDWLLANGDVEAAGQICGALRRFWWMRGEFREGRSWTARVLVHAERLAPLTCVYVHLADGMLAAAAGELDAGIAAFELAYNLARLEEDGEALGIAMHNLGNLLLSRGEYGRARNLLEAGLLLDRAGDDRWGLAISLGSLGDLAYEQGDLDAARAYYQESLEIYRVRGDQNSIALTLNNLGEIARRQNELDAAAAALAEGLIVARAGELRRMLPFLLTNLSLLALQRGQIQEARALLRESLALEREMGATQLLDTSLVAAAYLAHAEHWSERAITLLGAAQATRSARGMRIAPAERAEFDSLLATVRSCVPAEVFEAAWAAGLRLSIGEALRLAERV
jgi:predicted ATPase/DNA-binding XRE family transcriptional regulator/Tfp pilus assembly protein PilF